MPQPDPSYRERQEKQLKAYLEWQEKEGDEELPVQLTTLMAPHQRARLDWLRNNVTGEVLEVGTNYGLVLCYVKDPNIQGHAGIDINPKNITLAKILAPNVDFRVGDAKKLEFEDNSFDTVMLPEVLEHLLWPNEVEQAIKEALRVARQRILITVPDGRRDTPDATNFKHGWLADAEHERQIMKWLHEGKSQPSMIFQQGFCLISARLNNTTIEWKD